MTMTPQISVMRLCLPLIDSIAHSTALWTHMGSQSDGRNCCPTADVGKLIVVHPAHGIGAIAPNGNMGVSQVCEVFQHQEMEQYAVSHFLCQIGV